MKYYYVNQSETFDIEKKGGYLWADVHNKNISKPKVNDIILSFSKGKIVSANKVIRESYSNTKPDLKEYENHQWDGNGFKIDLSYYELGKPIEYTEYNKEILNNNVVHGFANNGYIKQSGYIHQIDDKIANFLINLMPNSIKLKLEIDADLSEEIDELLEEQEQLKKINSGVIKGYSKEEQDKLDNIGYRYKKTSRERKNISVREKTDAKLKATILEKAEYLCEINDTHTTFSNTSKEHQYMECHHIIPMNAQKDFVYRKLDSLYNIISVCPICHSQIHYASEEEKREIFNKMYDVRKYELIKKGFDITKMNEIFNKYYKNRRSKL